MIFKQNEPNAYNSMIFLIHIFAWRSRESMAILPHPNENKRFATVASTRGKKWNNAFIWDAYTAERPSKSTRVYGITEKGPPKAAAKLFGRIDLFDSQLAAAATENSIVGQHQGKCYAVEILNCHSANK